jgi:hypothetical protein
MVCPWDTRRIKSLLKSPATSQTGMTHGYLTLCIDSSVETTGITVLEGPFIGQKGWVDAIIFQQPTGSEERVFCYQATLCGSWKDCLG